MVNFAERTFARVGPQPEKRFSDMAPSAKRDGVKDTAIRRIVAAPALVVLGNPNPDSNIAVRERVVGKVPIVEQGGRSEPSRRLFNFFSPLGGIEFHLGTTSAANKAILLGNK